MAPDAGECVAVVVDLEAGSLGAILEDAIAFIMEKEIRRAIAGVKIRNRVVILVESQIVVVRAEIEVEASVPVVVGGGSVRERSRRRMSKPEGIRFEQEFSVSLVLKEKRATGADDQEILVSAVLEVRKQGASCAVEYADSCSVCHVLEGAVTTVAVQAVRQP